jgi:hypothetical protein
MTEILIVMFFCVLAAHFVWVVMDGKRAVTRYELEEEIRQLKKLRDGK